MSRRAPVDSLVHMVPATGTGGEVQLVVRLTVGADADEGRPPVRPVQVEVPTLEGRTGGAPGLPGDLDVAGVCTELTRSIGADDLAEAISVVATVAGCPTVLLRPDRSVLAAGEPRGPDRIRAAGPRPHTWHWAANGPQSDREIVICSGTHRLGVIAFQRPVRGRAEPIWEIVHDLLAVALRERGARDRAETAELQAALFACLSDEKAENPYGAAVPAGAVTYRPAVISPLTADSWSPDIVTRLHTLIGEQPLLASGRFARTEDRCVCLYAQVVGSDPRAHAEAWEQVLTAAAPSGCRVAVGIPGTRGAGLQESYRTARWLAAVQAAPTPGLRVEDVAVVDELGVVAGTLGPGWGPRVGHFIRRVLGDLVDNPRFGGEMVDTLHAYLVRGGSPAEAARLLHLSPSSMKYRMRIIRETLGDRLHDHDSVFEIELALRLLKAFEGSPTISENALPIDGWRAPSGAPRPERGCGSDRRVGRPDRSTAHLLYESSAPAWTTVPSERQGTGDHRSNGV